MHTLTEPTFTAFDRCDQCGAQAKLKAYLESGELLFCGHHGRKAGSALLRSAVRVFDPEGYMNMDQK